SYTDIPAIADIDRDGDMDILAISLLDNKVSLYKSMVKEKKLSMDSLDYKYQALCWGKFSMQYMPLEMLKNTCGSDTIDAIAPPKTPNAGSRHGGNSLWVFDEDKDNDYEILIGDVSYNYALYGKNNGSLKAAKMLESSIVYPSYSKPIDKLFPMGYWMDVDNDGNRDMIVTAHDQALNQGNKKAAFYKNIPKGDTSKFIYQTDSFMFDHLLDFGKAARPVFIDYNFDSLMDIVVSNDFNFDTPSNLYSTFSLFKNTGTKKFPKYTLINSNYANIKSQWTYNVHPCFGDLNRDTIPDLLFGTGGGKLYYAQGVKVNNELTFPNIQILLPQLNDMIHAHPHLADINSDGKLDLLVGDLDGNIHYIPGLASPAWPFFDTSKVNTRLGNINVADSVKEIYFDLYASPTVYSIDSTKTSYLFVSNVSGEIFQFKIDLDSLSKGSFKRVSKDLIPDRFKERTNIAMADLNSDGAMEILIGTESGGLNLYSFAKFDSTADTVIIIEEPNHIHQFATAKYAVYPNPTSGLIHIRLAENQFAHIEIYDEVGKMCFAKRVESMDAISFTDLPKGLYIMRIRMGDEVFHEKIMVE
ncbi:MAG: T9SS type A sorting domain-containing protein, partial [Chitinophagales bacterium]|nr:T9SS type A sorting domain-containing protein [Chitinophagales bacterium]